MSSTVDLDVFNVQNPGKHLKADYFKDNLKPIEENQNTNFDLDYVEKEMDKRSRGGWDVDVAALVRESSANIFEVQVESYLDTLPHDVLKALLMGETPTIVEDVAKDPILESMLHNYDQYLYNFQYNVKEVWTFEPNLRLDGLFRQKFDSIQNLGYEAHHAFIDYMINSYRECHMEPDFLTTTDFLTSSALHPDEKIKYMEMLCYVGQIDDGTLNIIFKQTLDFVRKTSSNPKAETALIVKRLLTLFNYSAHEIDEQTCYLLARSFAKMHDFRYMEILLEHMTDKQIPVITPLKRIIVHMALDESQEFGDQVLSEMEKHEKPEIIFPIISEAIDDREKLSLYVDRTVKHYEDRGETVPVTVLLSIAGKDLIQKTISLYTKMVRRGQRIEPEVYLIIMKMLYRSKMYDVIISLYQDMKTQKVDLDQTVFNFLLIALSTAREMGMVDQIYLQYSKMHKPKKDSLDEILERYIKPEFANHERILYYVDQYEKYYNMNHDMRSKITIVCRKNGWKPPFTVSRDRRHLKLFSTKI